MEEALFKSRAKPFPHEQAKRCRGIRDEEDVSYPETFISTASTAVWRERIRCHSWLPVWSSSGGEKVEVLCAKQHRRTVPPSNTAGSGLRVFCFTALIQSHAGRGRLWDCNSPHCRRIQLLQLPQGCSCCWGRAPHRGGHGVFLSLWGASGFVVNSESGHKPVFMGKSF